MKCLLSNEICGNTKKCEICILDDCKKTLELLEMKEKEKENFKLKAIKMQLNEYCKDCSMLQIIDLENEKLYCPYMITNKCSIAGYIKRNN